MSYTIIDDVVFDDQRLTSDDKLAFARIQRRLHLSEQHPEFFDRTRNQYFVHYSQAEMAETLGCSVRKIQSVYARLEKYGYILRSHRFNATDKIYVASLKANSAGPKQQKLPAKEQYTANNTDIQSNNTINTTRANSAIDRWRLASHNRLGLSTDVIKAIELACHRDVDKCQAFVKLMNNAKKHVLSHFGLKAGLLRYEINESLDQPLTTQILQANDYASDLDDNSRSKYFMRAFINFFKQSAGLDHRNWLIDRNERVATKPVLDPNIPIPMFKII